MSMSRRAVAVVAACIAICPGAAWADNATLMLVVGGEAYDGPPRFEVDFDGRPVGEGTVAAAIDTASQGRFADVADKTPYVQTFTFSLPDGAFRPDGVVEVRFLNEANGGQGSGRDRNLYLASVALNGRVVTASGLATTAGGGTARNQMVGEFLLLADGTQTAKAVAPPGGWPAPPGVATAATSSPAEPVAPAPAAAETPAMVAVPVKAATAEASASGCDLTEKYNVVGFNENSNELTPRLTRRLDQIVADIGARKCRVRVTGYSSKQGPVASSALFAIERAQNVLAYLKRQGMRFEQASAAGGGATEEFGPTPGANRRVVIAVSP